jgi:hypothetical protein
MDKVLDKLKAARTTLRTAQTNIGRTMTNAFAMLWRRKKKRSRMLTIRRRLRRLLQ